MDHPKPLIILRSVTSAKWLRALFSALSNRLQTEYYSAHISLFSAPPGWTIKVCPYYFVLRPKMAVLKVALIGANGNLGPAVLSALLSSPKLTVTVLTRSSSSSSYPPAVRTVSISDSLPVHELTNALRGQDALVITIVCTLIDEQIKLIDAAYAAGVKRVIPADFGSCDSADEYTLDLLPVMAGKARVRTHLEHLALQNGSALSWTSIITGHFFDHGLKDRLLLFDLPKRRVRLLDGGEYRWSASTLKRVGEAVLRVLEMEEETRNKILYVQSFCVTQNELLGILEKVMGTKWNIEHVNAGEIIKKSKEGVEKGDWDSIIEVVSVHGLVASNWEGKEGFSNRLLGLEEHDLEDAVRRVVECGP
jgi:nucleoside-diphosphate-sugar epimerase